MTDDTTDFSRVNVAKQIILEHKDKRNALIHNRGYDEVDSKNDIAPELLKVGILGGGMAGLYAGLLLQSLGIDYEILEANPKRAGGRVFTYRFNKEIGKHAKPGTPGYYDFFEVGAMRFPEIPMMDRVIGAQPYSLVEYLKTNCEDKFQPVMVPYYLEDKYKNTLLYFNGIKVTVKEAEEREKYEDVFHVGRNYGGDVPDAMASKPCHYWEKSAFQNLIDEVNSGPGGVKKLFDMDVSIRDYLVQNIKYPQELVDWIESRGASSGTFELALSEMIIDEVEFATEKWKCVDGGTDRLTEGMLSLLKNKPKLGCEVTKIEPSSNRVAITMKNMLPRDQTYWKSFGTLIGTSKKQDEKTTIPYTHVISTLPLGVLRGMNTDDCKFSYGKKQRITCSQLCTSVKIGLRFNTRWWQKGPAPIFGGVSHCDTPVRQIVYPSYGLDCKDAPGVLLASYTHSQDAARFGTMPQDEVVEICLRTLEKLHGDIVRKEYSNQYFIHNWYHDRYSQGAFATFTAGQFKTNYPWLLEPELNGRLCFAGEAASANHAWIVGALNSSYRAVWQILNAANRDDLKKKLIDNWGSCSEVDYGDLTSFARAKCQDNNNNN